MTGVALACCVLLGLLSADTRAQVLIEAGSSSAATGPMIQLGSKLTGGGVSGAAGFGFDVALSADGDTALIGGPFDTGDKGAAWVFTRSGSVWSQQGLKLIGSDEVGAGLFGHAVALSADGNTALIGGPSDNGHAGAAWVFTRSGGTWSQQGPKLTGSGANGPASRGISVALSADGNRALVGGSTDNVATGAAWVFTRSGSTWAQDGPKLTGSGATSNAGFGSSVALAARPDLGGADWALIGAPGDSNSVGAAWQFQRGNGAWSPQGKLTGNGEIGTGRFGASVALSYDGFTQMVGAPGDNNSAGAVWRYYTTIFGPMPQGILRGNGATGAASFGYDVSLAGPEVGPQYAIVGGPDDGNGVGAAWSFTKSDGVLLQDGAKLTAGDESGQGLFGGSVALSADAYTALSGGRNDANGVGAAWVFGIALAGRAYDGRGPPRQRAGERDLHGAGRTGRVVHGDRVTRWSERNRHCEPDHRRRSDEWFELHVHRPRDERVRGRAGVGGLQCRHARRAPGRPHGAVSRPRRRPGDGRLRRALLHGGRAGFLLHRDRLSRRAERERHRQPDHRLRADQRSEPHLHRLGHE